MNKDNVTTEETLQGDTTNMFGFDNDTTNDDTDFDVTKDKVVVALLELDKLRQEKQDTERHIAQMIDTIETLLEIEEADTDEKNFTSSVSIISKKTPSLKRNLSMRMTKNGKKPREG